MGRTNPAGQLFYISNPVGQFPNILTSNYDYGNAVIKGVLKQESRRSAQTGMPQECLDRKAAFIYLVIC